jgi:VanZ family protein
MSAKRVNQPGARLHWVHSTRLHVILYSLLLVATPFVMLQSYLQDAIAQLSRLSVPVGARQVPIVPTVTLLALAVLLTALRRHVTKLRALGAAVAVLMIALAQQISDYYFGHRFYDLQHNWHYIAYGIFAFMVYRDLAPRGVAPVRIVAITWLAALLFSTFDEAFQLRMSNRVFDIGDIAKDVWGTLTGVVLIQIVTSPPGTLLSDLRHFRHRRLRAYLQRPLHLLVLLFALSLLLLVFSSLLTEARYCLLVILFTLSGFGVVFVVIHVSQYRWGKYGLLTALVVAVAVQGYFVYRHRADYIVHNRPGLTVYKGIPIPFFDLLIFPDGRFRPVDRKEYFNVRDQRFLLEQEPRILLIGSGAAGRGGRGFPKTGVSQFMYNPHTQRGTQVIILRTPDACRVFNRLKRERKHVLFVLHNAG